MANGPRQYGGRELAVRSTQAQTPRVEPAAYLLRTVLSTPGRQPARGQDKKMLDRELGALYCAFRPVVVQHEGSWAQCWTNADESRYESYTSAVQADSLCQKDLWVLFLFANCTRVARILPCFLCPRQLSWAC